VFAGTTNKDAYFSDETGNRRFWPVACGPLNLDGIRADRDQLWAEAVHLYLQGERWHIDDADIAEEAERQQQERYEGDAWDEIVLKWAEDPDARRDEHGHPIADCVSTAKRVTITDVLLHGIGKPQHQWTQADKLRVQRCLVAEGYVRQRLTASDGRRTWFYALQ
jgi:predicted P-loop ATPase